MCHCGEDVVKKTTTDDEVLAALFMALSELEGIVEFHVPPINLEEGQHTTCQHYRQAKDVYNKHCDPLKKI